MPPGRTTIEALRLMEEGRSQGFSPAGYPAKPLASYQIKPTTIWVEPSSTGDPRRRGALRNPG